VEIAHVIESEPFEEEVQELLLPCSIWTKPGSATKCSRTSLNETWHDALVVEKPPGQNTTGLNLWVPATVIGNGGVHMFRQDE